ncbi:Microtubule bundling protein [Rhizina undulata]
MDTKNPSSLVEELTKVLENLNGLFDEIGLARYDREGREASVYAALNCTLQEQLSSAVGEKNALVEECQHLITSIKQMEKSLNDFKENHENLRVTLPLLRCLQGLKEKYQNVKKRHSERYDAIKKLVNALSSYATYMESSLVRIPLPPVTDDSSVVSSFDLSHEYYDKLEAEFERVYQEYSRRLATVDALAKEIINLYAELGVPSEQIDREIVQYGNSEPQKIGLRTDQIESLQEKKRKLVDERERRKVKGEHLKNEIANLWDKLDVDESQRKSFLAQHRGFDLKCIRELEDELQRMLELKRQNLHVFVLDARQKLQELWDALYFSDEEIMDFSPAFSDVYTDALLSAHEMEISRLKTELDERYPILSLIEKHRSLLADKELLEISSNDASRLMARGANRDPTRLLREEKMRKRIAKELPRVELELKKLLEKWEEDLGEEFMVKGEPYLARLMKLSAVGTTRAKTPTAGTATTIARARSVVQSSKPAPRSRSKGAEPEALKYGRSKTPVNNTAARPKTPSGGVLATASISRSGGRSVGASLQKSTVPPTKRSTDLLRSKTPTRTTPRAPQESTTIKSRNKGHQSTNSYGAPPRLRYATPTPAEKPRAKSQASIRSVSPDSLDDEESDGEFDINPTPRPIYTYYSRSAVLAREEALKKMRKEANEADERLQHARLSRQFSNNSAATMTSGTSGNGSENWETYGEESDDDDARKVYSRERFPGGNKGHGKHKSTGSMSSPLGEVDQWTS